MYFFFDIDGTLYEPKIGVCDSTRLALKKLQENGHLVAIATGRSYLGAVDIADELGIDYLVCDGGNTIYHKHQCIYRHLLPLAEYEKMAKLAEEYKIPYIYADDEHYYGTKAMPSFEAKHPWLDYQGFKPLKDVAIMKFAFEVSEKQSEMLAKKIEVNTLLFKDVLCLVSDPNNKGNGIKECAKLLGINEIVVFGDSMNDVDMFKVADYAICMGQALDIVKKEADYVCEPVNKDGIYKACKIKGWI